MKNTAYEFLNAHQSIKAQSSSSAALNGSAFNARGYDECLVVLNAGAATGAASTVVSIRQSDDSSLTNTAAISGASFTAIDSTNHNLGYVARIDLRKLDLSSKPYLYAKGVGDGANAQVYGVTLVFLNGKVRPESPDQTVGFNI